MLNELRNEIYDDAVKHGLWDEMLIWKLIATNEDFRKSGIADMITAQAEMKPERTGLLLCSLRWNFASLFLR